ncbi:hypothetical protein GCK72_017649 [Caenorhabditis remanei]|uniref:Eukaryotic translation initiation factor 3 subunit K n=1 Tax=Caenorhabditis remanei TaxID=31234 RepID=A0A6A5G7V9_CAERE|nr:hypothetical protein GCK72_017649 [Caenorhabditis remanei]KAF1751097.1 hypothetical protein GCK72_017649 [Caenorhabditis remanei]
MRVVLQRVTRAAVTVSDEVVGSIGKGLCVLVGIHREDTEEDMKYIIRKILNLRIFPASEQKPWDKSVMDLDLEVLSVSQFTLYGQFKGNKLDFHTAMAPTEASKFYETFLESMKKAYKPEKIQDGKFAAMMSVDIMSFERLQRDLHEAIEGVNRYNPENVSDLAACVQAMVAENKYDKDIVLTILKLYQLNPEKYDEAVVRQVLLKTLMVLPSSDFALAKCLIDTNRLGSQELRRIFDLGAVLESCNFAVFWKLMKGTYKPSTNTTEPFKVPSEIPKMVKHLVGFEDSIKHYACRVISVTFQNIEKKLLSRLLGGASDKEVTALAKKFGWEAKENGDVFFVANHEGTIKTRNIDEKIQFSHVADLLTSIQPPLTH